MGPPSRLQALAVSFSWWRIELSHFSYILMAHFFPLERFKNGDIPSTVLKGAPEFCNIYIISKGKMSSMRSASCPAPSISTLQSQMLAQSSSRSSMADSDISQSNRQTGLFDSSFSHIYVLLASMCSKSFPHINEFSFMISNQKTQDHQLNCRKAHGIMTNLFDSKCLAHFSLYISECNPMLCIVTAPSS